MAKSKILILDGIGGISLGQEMAATCRNLGVDTIYANLAKLDTIPFYRTRSVIAKSFNKTNSRDDFFHLPRVHKQQMINLLKQHLPTHILVV